MSFIKNWILVFSLITKIYSEPSYYEANGDENRIKDLPSLYRSGENIKIYQEYNAYQVFDETDQINKNNNHHQRGRTTSNSQKSDSDSHENDKATSEHQNQEPDFLFRTLYHTDTYPDHALANEIINSRTAGEKFYLRLNHTSIQYIFYNTALPTSKGGGRLEEF